MKTRGFWKPALIIFVILLGLSVLLSYHDDRDADGYLTIGFPLKFYSLLYPLVGGSVSNFNYINFIGDLIIFLAISILITFLYQKFK